MLSKNSTIQIQILLVCFLFNAMTGFGAEASAETLKQMRKLQVAMQTFLDEGGSWRSEEYNKLNRDFQAAVQKNASMFQQITPVYESGTNAIVKVVLNKAGAGFDAIRFTNKSSKPKDLVWVFAYPQPAHFRWNILASHGDMRGFSAASNGAKHYPGAPWKAEQSYSTKLQTLASGEIKGGSDYIIWFSFTDNQPHTFYIGINLLSQRDLIAGPAVMELDLGLRTISDESQD